jgi:hypothetical protein
MVHVDNLWRGGESRRGGDGGVGGREESRGAGVGEDKSGERAWVRICLVIA